MPRPGFRLILKTAWFFSGLSGCVKIAVEIIAERSIPNVRPGTNRPGSIKK